MGNLHIYAPMWQTLTVPLDGAVQGLIASLMAWIGPVLQVGVPAYLIIMLMIAAWGTDETAFIRFFGSLWRAVVIYALATVADSFNYYVSGLIHGLEDEIMNAIAGSLTHGATVGADSFDKLQTQLFALGGPILKNISFYAPKTWINLLILAGYFFVSSLAVVVMFVEYLATYCIQQVLIAFGPLFIACLCFPFTRRYFDGWLSVVVTTLLTQIFVVGLLAMFIDVMTAVVSGVAVATGAAAAGTLGSGNMAVQAMILLVAGATSTSFGCLTVFLTYTAAKIGGSGFHTEFRKPAIMPSPAPPSPPAPIAAAGAGASQAQLPAPANAVRDYPFNRHVGGAP